MEADISFDYLFGNDLLSDVDCMVTPHLMSLPLAVVSNFY